MTGSDLGSIPQKQAPTHAKTENSQRRQEALPFDRDRQGQASPGRHQPLGGADGAQAKRKLRGTKVLSTEFTKQITEVLAGNSY